MLFFRELNVSASVSKAALEGFVENFAAAARLLASPYNHPNSMTTATPSELTPSSVRWMKHSLSMITKNLLTLLATIIDVAEMRALSMKAVTLRQMPSAPDPSRRVTLAASKKAALLALMLSPLAVAAAAAAITEEEEEEEENVNPLLLLLLLPPPPLPMLPTPLLSLLSAAPMPTMLLLPLPAAPLPLQAPLPIPRTPETSPEASATATRTGRESRLLMYDMPRAPILLPASDAITRFTQTWYADVDNRLSSSHEYPTGLNVMSWRLYMTAPPRIPSSAPADCHGSAVPRHANSSPATDRLVRLRMTMSVTALTSWSASRLLTSMSENVTVSGTQSLTSGQDRRGMRPMVKGTVHDPSASVATAMPFWTTRMRLG